MRRGSIAELLHYLEVQRVEPIYYVCPDAESLDAEIYTTSYTKKNLPNLREKGRLQIGKRLRLLVLHLPPPSPCLGRYSSAGCRACIATTRAYKHITCVFFFSITPLPFVCLRLALSSAILYCTGKMPRATRLKTLLRKQLRSLSVWQESEAKGARDEWPSPSGWSSLLGGMWVNKNSLLRPDPRSLALAIHSSSKNLYLDSDP